VSSITELCALVYHLSAFDNLMICFTLISDFNTLVDTQQWAQPVTAGVHGVSSRKCRLEVVE